MAELPAYPTDADICRLLADGPLPTAAIAARLAVPDRTVRHRLARLRLAGAVATGTDGRHRLAEGPLPAIATATADLAATGDGPPAVAMTVVPAAIPSAGNGTDGGNRAETALPGGYRTVLAVLAAAAIGLAAAVLIRQRPPDPPPPAVLGPGDWGPWTGW